MTRKGKKFVWDDKEIDFLKENYGKISQEDIGKRLGISFTTVRIKALELGLEYKQSLRACKWSDEQINFLRENYSQMPYSDLSSAIGYSYGTIQRKAKELGLKRAEGYDRNGFRNRYVGKYKKVV